MKKINTFFAYAISSIGIGWVIGILFILLWVIGSWYEYEKYQTKQDYSQENTQNSIDIYAWGDIMLSRTVGYLNKKEGSQRIFSHYNPITNFSGWIALFNLESPFGEKDNDKNIVTTTFSSNKNNQTLLPEIIGSNSWAFSLANNHISNAGKKGISLTKEIITNQKLSYFGVPGKDFLVFEKKWKKICVEWYSYDGNNKDYKRLDAQSVAFDLEKMKKSQCDVKIIFPHWWQEYKIKPNKKQQDLAHSIIESGADIIIGSHSHIFWEVENYKGKYIFYSLGNYIFDQNWGKKSCDPDMDCIYDESLKKKTVPTYIGTLIHLQYDISTQQISLKQTLHTRIDNGKISPY